MSGFSMENHIGCWDAFFCFPDGDLIIRTEGRLGFKVHKSVMGMISNVFRDMFSLEEINLFPVHPPPPLLSYIDPETKKTLALVDVPEDNSVIRYALGMIYHAPRAERSFVPMSIDFIQKIVDVIDRYDMPRLREPLQDLILTDFHSLTPIRFYAVAKLNDLDRVAKATLPYVVGRNIHRLPPHEIPDEMGSLPFREYHKLHFFSERRAALIIKALDAVTPPPCLCKHEGNNISPDTRIKCDTWAIYLKMAKKEVAVVPTHSITSNDFRSKAAQKSACPFAHRWLFDERGAVFIKLENKVKTLLWAFDSEYSS
ncbi:hypothetical protein SISNIDRAFT_463385 [Sistotremastrum niveocremeum HHB9708]|uniref:BTB domain-containing protein n=1 Tax=Sistotremastrum niveocremeum HHB9708 TaxID=1314777 RepID=A0A164Y5Q3_9AGAM|nr:hypothetical protein SISNIDRAFT_463385 [Sistotremastrum niveocremeum HHB9708]